MTSTHAQQFWTAGDDWQIDATLLDANGNPFDLNSTIIKWALMDASFRRALDETDVNIAIRDAAEGQCSIMVPAEKTSPLLGARYSDYIRVISGGITSTLSNGLIYVAADPWFADRVDATAMTTLSVYQRTYTKPRLVA